jgi:hypothetical protein
MSASELNRLRAENVELRVRITELEDYIQEVESELAAVQLCQKFMPKLQRQDRKSRRYDDGESV